MPRLVKGTLLLQRLVQPGTMPHQHNPVVLAVRLLSVCGTLAESAGKTLKKHDGRCLLQSVQAIMAQDHLSQHMYITTDLLRVDFN